MWKKSKIAMEVIKSKISTKHYDTPYHMKHQAAAVELYEYLENLE